MCNISDQSLSQYEMRFLPQKVVKGQAVTDFLVEHPDPRTIELYEDLPDEIAEVCLTQILSKDKCGNFSLTVHREQAQKDIS